MSVQQTHAQNSMAEQSRQDSYQLLRLTVEALLPWLETLPADMPSPLDGVQSLLILRSGPAATPQAALQMLLAMHCDRCGARLERDILGDVGYVNEQFIQLCSTCFADVGWQLPEDTLSLNRAIALAHRHPKTYWAALLSGALLRTWSFALLAQHLDIASSRLLVLIDYPLPPPHERAAHAAQLATLLGFHGERFRELLDAGCATDIWQACDSYYLAHLAVSDNSCHRP